MDAKHLQTLRKQMEDNLERSAKDLVGTIFDLQVALDDQIQENQKWQRLNDEEQKRRAKAEIELSNWKARAANKHIFSFTEMSEFHPRAWRLMAKNKRFVVVAVDEPYFMTVYGLIRSHEMSKNTWTGTDEKIFGQAMEEWANSVKMGPAQQEVDPEVEKVWSDFWLEIVSNPDGSLDLAQLKRELYDYRICMEEVSKVYDSITNGRYSKPNTAAPYVIDAVEAQIQEGIRSVIEEMKEESLEGQITRTFKARSEAHNHVLECELLLDHAIESVSREALYQDRTKWILEEEKAVVEIERLRMVIEARKVSKL